MASLLTSPTWKTLQERWERLSFEALEQEEKEAIALFWLEGEVMNGGLHQFFSNSSGNLLPEAISGLRRVKAEITLGLVEQAAAKLGSGPYPTDRAERSRVLAEIGQERDLFEEETDAIQDLPEPFLESVIAVLEKRYQKSHF